MAGGGHQSSSKFQPRHVLPCEVSLALCMGQDSHLGAKSVVRVLVPELVHDIAMMVRRFFIFVCISLVCGLFFFPQHLLLYVCNLHHYGKLRLPLSVGSTQTSSGHAHGIPAR
jgi:hypothetical protein